MNKLINYRYERKFFSKMPIKEVEFLIRLNPYIFLEIFLERRVNNIYFDSPNHDYYKDNIEGTSERKKIRIRWYGNTFGKISEPRLEIKTKTGEIGRKIEFPLKEFSLDENFSLKKVQDVFQKSEIPREIISELKKLNFTLLNSYKRKYFISGNKKFRITLDYELTFCDMKQFNNSFMNKILDKETTILEIKYNQKDDEDASVISQYFPFRLTKSSKYVYGIDLLNN